MNYRHGYHAGNAGDVLKHLVLMLVLEHLLAKPKPFVVIDTHAGAGITDLDGPEAVRTGEWADGIGRLLEIPDPPAALCPYLAAVRSAGPDGRSGDTGTGSRWYPGSPLLARAALRPGDRLVAIEAHAETQTALAANLGGAKGVSTRCADGYGALAGLLPPPERRGLVLIDPPFESRTEFADMALALRRAHRRFATGHYLLWYPIKDPGLVESFHQDVFASGIPRVLRVDLTVKAVTRVAGMAGAGLLVVNPPWRLDESLRALLPWLATRLAQGDGGGWRLDWLRGES